MQNKIEFLENYLAWVNDNRLDPPSFSPEEYALHLRNISNQDLLDAMVAMVEKVEDADKIIEFMLIALEGAR